MVERMIKVISFDIGGTLIKRPQEESLVKQLSELSSENVCFVKHAYVEHFMTKQISLEDFFKKIKIVQTDRAVNIINRYYEEKQMGTVWEEVPEVLTKIRNADIEIIALSNKSYRNPFTLKSYGLQSWFSQEIYSFDIGYAKPNISIFRFVQTLLQVNPQEILHVGDSFISDYLGAQKAGWNSIWLNRNQSIVSESLESLSYITRLHNLPADLKKYI